MAIKAVAVLSGSTSSNVSGVVHFIQESPGQSS
jgi:hypothetical protein